MAQKPNVHISGYTEKGKARYGVGIWSGRSNQYTAPLDAVSQRANPGCYAEFSRKPIGRMTKRAAMSKARELWGYALCSE